MTEIDLRAQSRKVRWTVPAGDSSVQAWLDVQDNVSVSLRLLIRESIERDGYADVMNRPVKQLPRRGRPPKDAAGDADDQEGEALVAVEATREPGWPSQQHSEPEGKPEQPTQIDMDDIFGHKG